MKATMPQQKEDTMKKIKTIIAIILSLCTFAGISVLHAQHVKSNIPHREKAIRVDKECLDGTLYYYRYDQKNPGTEELRYHSNRSAAIDAIAEDGCSIDHWVYNPLEVETAKHYGWDLVPDESAGAAVACCPGE